MMEKTSNIPIFHLWTFLIVLTTIPCKNSKASLIKRKSWRANTHKINRTLHHHHSHTQGKQLSNQFQPSHRFRTHLLRCNQVVLAGKMRALLITKKINHRSSTSPAPLYPCKCIVEWLSRDKKRIVQLVKSRKIQSYRREKVDIIIG
jgi:hypothetical protein